MCPLAAGKDKISGSLKLENHESRLLIACVQPDPQICCMHPRATLRQDQAAVIGCCKVQAIPAILKCIRPATLEAAQLADIQLHHLGCMMLERSFDPDSLIPRGSCLEASVVQYDGAIRQESCIFHGGAIQVHNFWTVAHLQQIHEDQDCRMAAAYHAHRVLWRNQACQHASSCELTNGAFN